MVWDRSRFDAQRASNAILRSKQPDEVDFRAEGSGPDIPRACSTPIG